jgi:hypothetical protein
MVLQRPADADHAGCLVAILSFGINPGVHTVIKHTPSIIGIIRHKTISSSSSALALPPIAISRFLPGGVCRDLQNVQHKKNTLGQFLVDTFKGFILSSIERS